MITPSRKGNIKILEKYESKSDWEEDVDTTTTQAIIKLLEKNKQEVSRETLLPASLFRNLLQ